MLLEVVVPVTLFTVWLLCKCCRGLFGRSAGGGGGTLWNLYGNGSFRSIANRFSSVEEVTTALRKSGLESSNLIFGIDYTMSNTYQGEKTFGGMSLHHLNDEQPNPYQQVISVIGRTLSQFDEDGVIPAYGFGDLNTKDQSVFPLHPQGYCIGVDGVLDAYKAVTSNVRMSGPTSFAPLIRRAIDIVKQTKSFHILVIIADGQVTNERSTVEAIVSASHFPLSIIMVGVGDGPWHMMKEFDDRLPERQFDNFQFVEFHKIITSRSTYKNPDAAFALQALMEIPDQYRAIRKLNMVGS